MLEKVQLIIIIIIMKQLVITLSQLLSVSAIYTNFDDVKYFWHIDKHHSILVFFHLCSSVECRFLGQRLSFVLCLGLQCMLGWLELKFTQTCCFFI